MPTGGLGVVRRIRGYCVGAVPNLARLPKKCAESGATAYFSRLIWGYCVAPIRSRAKSGARSRAQLRSRGKSGTAPTQSGEIRRTSPSPRGVNALPMPAV